MPVNIIMTMKVKMSLLMKMFKNRKLCKVIKVESTYKNTASPLNKRWNRQTIGWLAVEKKPMSPFPVVTFLPFCSCPWPPVMSLAAVDIMALVKKEDCLGYSSFISLSPSPVRFSSSFSSSFCELKKSSLSILILKSKSFNYKSSMKSPKITSSAILMWVTFKDYSYHTQIF